MLNSFAEVYLAINDSSRSLASAREAVALWRRLLEQEGGNRAWLIGLAQSRQRLGIALAVQGDSSDALAALREAEAVLRPLAGPDDPQAQGFLALALAQLGQVLQVRGEEREGEKCFREALALREQLARRPDARALWRRNLASSQQRIADLLWARGEYEPAEKLYAEGLALIERVVKEEPEDAEWQSDLVRAHWNMGFVHERRGDGKSALAEYETSVALARPFTLQDPGNVQWQQRLLRGHRKSTDVFVNPDELTRGRILEAFRQRAEATRQDLALTERLERGDPANADLKHRAAELRRELAVNLAALGRLGDKPRENLAEAIAVLGPARDALAELARRDPVDVSLVNSRFLVASAQSDALRAQGKEREARQASLDGALIQLEAALARARERPDDSRVQTELLAARFQVATARTLLAAVDAEPRRQYQAALEPLALARAGYERLHEHEPDNRVWLERLSVLYFDEATALRELGRGDEAPPLEAKAKAARERLQQLRAKAPSDYTPPPRWCSISAVALDLISLQALIGSRKRALALLVACAPGWTAASAALRRPASVAIRGRRRGTGQRRGPARTVS
jgi:tetratricopeptide (TPR) repeat protein